MPLNRERVLDEALRLVDEDGLDALSLRTLAARLKVQAPTLYWHVKNKAELIDGLADAIMDEAIAALPNASAPDASASNAGGTGVVPPEAGARSTDATHVGRTWFLNALISLRAALLRHRDGARLISSARYSLRRGDFSERAMATLVQHGMGAQDARLLVLVGERFAVGWVLEEQSPQADGPRPTVEELQARFPVASRASGDYFVGTGRGPDDLFRDAVTLVVGSRPGTS